MERHKSLLRVYLAYVVRCSKCGYVATYSNLNAPVPKTVVVEQAEREGWKGTPQGNVCPDCKNKTG
jgi:uncharacterized Zn finger protein